MRVIGSHSLHFSDGLHPVGIPSCHHDGERLRGEFESADAHHGLNAEDTEAEHSSGVEHASLVLLRGKLNKE